MSLKVNVVPDENGNNPQVNIGQSLSTLPVTYLSPTPVKIADIPFSSFTASTTLTSRFASVFNRNALARTIMVVNKLNQPASGNVNLVGYDSLFPKPTYAYTGSQSVGTLTSNSVGVLGGSILGTSASTNPVPLFGLDSLEIQFPMGATAPTSGNVEVWLVELK